MTQRLITPQELEGNYHTLLCAETGYKISKKLQLVTRLGIGEDGVLKATSTFSVLSFGDCMYVGESIVEALNIYNNIRRVYKEPEPSY